MAVSAAAVRRCEHDPALLRACWPVVAQLRPHLDPTGFLDAVQRQRGEGYRVAAAFDGEACVAFAGYRIVHMLAHGRQLYVDDLVTDEAVRGSGAGTRLFDWLVAEARQEACASLQLDSGTWRHAAHAFYFARRMHVMGFHFALPLEG